MMGQVGGPQEGLNSRQVLVVVLVNVLLLAELTLSIYLGKQDPEEITWIFLRTFVPLVVFTLVTAKIVLRRLGRARARPVSHP